MMLVLEAPQRGGRCARCMAALALWLVLAPGAARALPLISEVFYDATGADDAQVFVELFALPGSVLDGLTLEGVNGSGGAVGPVVALSGVVPADGLFVVADRNSAGSTLVPGADLLANFDFQNGPDSIQLRDGARLLDAVGYGVFGAGSVFAGEGSSAPDAPAGSSLARVFADIDTDENAFDFEVLMTPTPGVAAFSAVPEPGTASMLCAGLVVLWRLGRRRA